jgi:lipopolysaccharide/colanic/teichoic acid biosynthesis glycosyltransferase
MSRTPATALPPAQGGTAGYPLKRGIDLAGSLIGLVLAAPLMLGVGVALRATVGSPVIFRQTRSGLRGEPFVLFKFRTMRDAVDAEGRPLPDGERITSLGRFLRSTSLDELPSLVNVLKGEMSLVGPRPLLPEYLPLYSEEQARRHAAKPGVTGWAQVNGRNALSWEDRFQLDVWYVENLSLALDIRILFRTISKVAGREGIHAEGHPTMERFRGSPG